MFYEWLDFVLNFIHRESFSIELNEFDTVQSYKICIQDFIAKEIRTCVHIFVTDRFDDIECRVTVS